MGRPKLEPEESVKRHAILEAALQLFAQLGYHGTTVPQIAERAQVGAGTVYRYFESKEAIVNELFQHWKMELGRTLMANFPVGQPMRTQFKEIWLRLAFFAHKYPVALDFLELHHHSEYLDKASRKVETEMLTPLYAFVQHAQELQQIKDHEPAVLGALVWGAFMGLVQAVRKGLITELDRKTLDIAEEAMWQAVRR